MTSRRSSGSMRADSAVEPTRSENITVTWRRSADADAASVAASGLLTLFSCWLNFAIALRMRRRWACARYTDILQQLVVNLPKQINVKIVGLAKASAYWARPIESSHLRTSLMLRVALKALWLLS